MAIEDYLKGSSQAYGQLAGSLLAGRKKQDKKEAKRALIASTVMATFGALQNKQKQDIIDGSNEVKEKYGEIFLLNKAEFEGYEEERASLKEYNKNKEVFLNSEVEKIIDNTDEAVTARVKWADVDKQPDKNLTESMYAAYNSEREKLQNRMEALNVDPRATTKSFEKFNQRATDEYKAALALVEDDPTKKGLIKAAWNRIFKTERNEEGELVTTNSDLLDLKENLKLAKEGRTTFRDSIEKQVTKKQIYNKLIFKDKDRDRDTVYAEIIPALMSAGNNMPRFKDVDSMYYMEAVNNILDENPNLSNEEISAKAFSSMVQGTLDPTAYKTRQGALIANGISLINSFEDQSIDERKQALEKEPTLLLKLMDAYKNDNQPSVSQGLGVIYKDIYEVQKAFEPSQQQKLSYVERLNIRLDSKRDKELLANSSLLGVIAANSAHSENYFKKNNPDWADDYTEVEIQDEALTYTLEKMDKGNSVETKLVKADLLKYKMDMKVSKVDMSLIDSIPSLIKELKDANRESEIVDVRNLFIKYVSENKNLEESEDEKEEIKNEINDNFEMFKLDSFENTSSRVNTIMEDLDVQGLLSYRRGAQNLYLKNFNNTVENVDFSTLSNEELKYLYNNSSNVKTTLGIDKEVRLSNKGIETGNINTKIRKVLGLRFKDLRDEQGKISKFLNQKGEGVRPTGKFVNDFTNSLLSESLELDKDYITYKKRFTS